MKLDSGVEMEMNGQKTEQPFNMENPPTLSLSCIDDDVSVYVVYYGRVKGYMCVVLI